MNNTLLPKGVYVAALTPMHDDLTVDTSLLTYHCQQLLEAGAQGLALMGTTGEANSLSLTERKTLLEEILEKGVDPGKIMLGTGCCAYPDTIDLTRHAVRHGIKSILLLPPFYYKQVDDAGLFDYFKKVIHETGAGDLEIYLYHFPKMTGLHLSLSLLDRLISEFPRNVVGMKDSGGDLQHMQDIATHFPGFKLFAGTEKYLLDVLRMGGAGCISATANVTITQCMDVFDHWLEPSADERQEALTAQRMVFEGLPFIGILKAYLAIQKKTPQWSNVRPPNSLVKGDEVDKVIKKMKELGVGE